MVREAFEAMRSFQSSRSPRERLHWKPLLLYAWPSVDFQPAEAGAVINRFAHGPGRDQDGPAAAARRRRGPVLRMFNPAGRGVAVELGGPPTRPLQPLDEGAQRHHLRAPPRARAPGRIVKLLDSDLRSRPGRRRARPGRPAGRHQHREHRGRADPQRHRSPPRGNVRVALPATRRAGSVSHHERPRGDQAGHLGVVERVRPGRTRTSRTRR